MSSEQEQDFRPTRTENILNEEARTIHTSTSMADTYTGSVSEEAHHGHREESVERPMVMPTSSFTDFEDELSLQRTRTTQSVRDRRAFEPIHSGDREELKRIASSFDGELSLARSRTRDSSALQRIDTLAGVNIGDPVLDPKSPEFDAYKWSRM
jgi:ATP-binding cassette subfamily G (WHITE) protein 2 (PDR)